MLGTRDLPDFLLASLLLWIPPGPDTMDIPARGIAPGLRAGALSAPGIGCDLLIHTAPAAFGLSAPLALLLGGLFVTGGTLWCLLVAMSAARGIRRNPGVMARLERPSGRVSIGLGLNLLRSRSRPA